MTTHALKCWPEPFSALMRGEKTAEFRRDDRGFEVGDMLEIREWDFRSQTFLGSWMHLRITHIVRGPASGVPDGFAMLSLAPPPSALESAAVEWVRLRDAAIRSKRERNAKRCAHEPTLEDLMRGTGDGVACWAVSAHGDEMVPARADVDWCQSCTERNFLHHGAIEMRRQAGLRLRRFASLARKRIEDAP